MRTLGHYLIATLTLGLTGPFWAADKIDDLINQLEIGNDLVLKQLLDKREVVLKRLLLRRPASKEVKSCLKQLGHEKHDTRVEAAKTLLLMGAGIIPEVRAEMNATEDPEIKIRCKELLKDLSQRNAKVRATQRIKVLAEIPNLPPAVIHRFEYAYREYMKGLRNDEPDEDQDSEETNPIRYPYLSHLPEHYSVLPNSAKDLCDQALNVSGEAE